MKFKELAKTKIPSYWAFLIIILVASFFLFAIISKIQDNAREIEQTFAERLNSANY